jgi:signal transduction histidine kinase
MSSKLGIALLACGCGAVVLGIADGPQVALGTFGLLAAVSGIALGAALIASRRRARLGSLTNQLAVAVWIAVGAILIAVWAAASVMFISGHDALLVSVMAAVVAIVGVSVSTLLTNGMVVDVERLRDRLRAVGRGDRTADLGDQGGDELSEVTSAANTMIERLSSEEQARAAAEDARRRLIVAVSHDLRTPIASLRLLTEAIEDGIATGELRARYLREMQTHVATLAALVEDLFDYSRLQAGEIQLSARRVEVGELVSETVAAMRVAADQRAVRLTAEPVTGQATGQALAARGDAEQIRRVLLNLLDNAITHTPDGGSVTVSTIRRGQFVEVEIADEGSGIAPKDREHVFEAFFRGGEDASRSRDGAGLGLSIARAIVHAHRGEIWLAPAETGTRVCFSLPAEAEQAVHSHDLSLQSLTSSARAG